VVVRQAFGTSMEGVPATTDMHFPNGNVAFAYLGTLLMEFVDEHEVGLDDTIDRWMPDLPEADEVTLRMLANHTSGYPDYETDPAFIAAYYADPFHIWTFQERLAHAFSRPVLFAPGTNWAYAHTNFMILGEILAEIGGRPLATLLSEKVLGPMGLTGTAESQTSAVPEPVLHAYTSERREALGIPAETAFSEESTFWNKQWGTPIGANQMTTIDDMATSAVQVGTGSLLSESGYEAMTGPDLVGFGSADPACAPACRAMTDDLNFGLGVVRSGSWLLQAPSLGGYSETMAYLPSQGIAIAVVITFLPAAYDAQGNNASSATSIFQSIGELLAPDDPPPTPNG
jgi:CubicO group peptidase (beta-lactamase class C family)